MNELKKSIGGFLPLHINYHAGEWYKDNTIKLNSARNAIVVSMMQGGYHKVYLPVYTCESVQQTLNKYGYKVEYYNIGNDFNPLLDDSQIDEICSGRAVLLVVNYFGVFFPSHKMDAIDNKNIIIDNTQCFYETPNLEAYNVYSCRKFFGVSDGAYLVKKGLRKIDLEQDFSSSRASFLLKSFEKGTNEVYGEYINAEEDISDSKILRMSLLTESILSSIDYERVNKIRLENFRFLHEKLASINQLKFDIPETSPMVYPLLVEDDQLRHVLIENKIYISQWWKWVLSNNNSNDFEKKLSKYLLPLPIDQRYDLKDMEMVAAIIIDNI